jgi:ABC-type glycerol-3-phosphate transport system substrate-binding protein
MLEAEQMAFAARALAQSHPFTQMAKTIADAAVENERKEQPGDFSIWAGAALTKGYCVRRVEEDDAGMVLAGAAADVLPDPKEVEEAAAQFIKALQSPDAPLDFLLADQEGLLEVLDRVIGSEVRNRLDTAPTNLTSRGRAELEDYLTYWVIRGYALRTAELATGALAKVEN